MLFKKLLHIPGPKDLGMSKHNNSMAIALFRNYPGELTWEDYHARIKKEYPVKYLIKYSIPKFFSYVYRKATTPIKDFIYWFKCHTIKEHKYHLIDIRNETYKYGWLDTDSRMELALFSLLVEFVEKELDSYHTPTEKDAIADDQGIDPNIYTGVRKQYNNYKEYMSIYNYWKYEKPILDKQHSDKINEWYEAHKQNPFSKLTKKLAKEKSIIEDNNTKKLNDMLHRLIDIRKSLWT